MKGERLSLHQEYHLPRPQHGRRCYPNWPDSVRWVGWKTIALWMVLVPMIGCNSKPATDQSEVKPPPATDTIAPDRTSEKSDSTTRLKPEQVAEPAPESFQVDRVQALIQAGDFEAAGKILHPHLVANPNDPVALFTLAQLHAASDDLETAIKTLRHPAIKESDAALPALGTTADWLVQLGRSEEAADCYRQMLQVAPDAVMIHRRLASLMIRMGRPPLAQASLRRLCRSGNIQRPELAALISISQADSDRSIGPVAEARRLAKQHDYQGAVDRLAARSETEYQTPDVSAFQTRMLAETQQDKMVAKRLVQGRVEQKAYSDYWAALGIHSLRRKDAKTAITAFSNAIAIDPTDASSLQRLSQAYRTSGDVESADRLHQQFRRVLKSIRLSNQIAAAPSEATAIEDLAEVLDSLDRRLEAVLWRTIAASHQPDADDNIQNLQTQFARLAKSDDAFPITPLPEALQVPTSIATEEPDNVSKRHRWMASRQSGVWPAPPTTASWRNVAADVGLDHQFRVAKTPQSKAFSIYQSLGGGVAAIDYDLDGRCDLYCAQGAADPPEFRSDEPNPLYRNTGEKVTDFSHLAGTGESTYTVGVTAGDWNQDGFDDLAVNQFGSIVLLTNCADGTFRRDVLLSKPTTWLPSSIAISDVNADGLQDLIALAYADSEGIWKKPPVNEEGRPTYLIGPASFSGAANLALLGTSTGWETDFEEIRTPEAPVADTSLGLIVGLNLRNRHSEPNDIENQVNSIFIGNDQQNDRLWTHSNLPANAWTETAMVHGCAFGSFGNPSASMGIAAADFNQDGHDDLHITNFQDEPASLFYGCRSGFRDHSIGSGLHRHSFSVLGFGTAALDFDLNGLPDLMVTNGYIDDPAEQDQPYEQPMQLLVRQDRKYRLQTVTDPSGYWAKPHVGRAMARLDFDGDGRDDVAITNLTETSAILVNQTDTLHHWIRLALVGKDSPRNAIGAAITVVAGERTFSHRVTAGDGFLCRDQPAMTIGLGNHSEDVSIEVRWPNGHTQRWDDVSIDSAWLLTESDSLPYQMPPF